MSAHVIFAISYGPKDCPASSLDCSCGEGFRAPTPEALEAQWHAHRRQHGLWVFPPNGTAIGPKTGRRFDYGIV